MGTSSVQTLKNNTKRSWSLDDIFKQVEGELAPDTTRTYLEDILAISCCIQRLSNSDSNRFNRSLNSPELPAQVNDLDRQKAENIRKYYKDKLLMLTLQGRELTKYRKDLQKFLHGNPLQVPDSLAGIVYRLPYFYDYDKEIDGIFQSSYFKNNNLPNMREPVQRDLKFLKRIENQRRRMNNIEYWFEDDKLNKVMFSITGDNPLLTLLDRHIGNTGLSITGKYFLRKKDLNEYFVMEKWSFV
jgi:hypothetical protein